MAKYDVYKDGEGDWTIIPAGEVLAAPVVVAAMNGNRVDTIEDVAETIRNNPTRFLMNQTNVQSQSVVDKFGPYTLVGTIEVDA